jgi:hypothetical protein
VADNWVILQSPRYKEWYRNRLADEERDAIVAAALHLKVAGPALRRPLSGSITASKYANMKELIPPAGNVRILYIFDPERHAIFLLGGDKTHNWAEWYATNIPIAEAIYEQHLAALTAAPTQSPKKKTRGRKR